MTRSSVTPLAVLLSLLASTSGCPQVSGDGARQLGPRLKPEATKVTLTFTGPAKDRDRALISALSAPFACSSDTRVVFVDLRVRRADLGRDERIDTRPVEERYAQAVMGVAPLAAKLGNNAPYPTVLREHALRNPPQMPALATVAGPVGAAPPISVPTGTEIGELDTDLEALSAKVCATSSASIDLWVKRHEEPPKVDTVPPPPVPTTSAPERVRPEDLPSTHTPLPPPEKPRTHIDPPPPPPPPPPAVPCRGGVYDDACASSDGMKRAIRTVEDGQAKHDGPIPLGLLKSQDGQRAARKPR